MTPKFEVAKFEPFWGAFLELSQLSETAQVWQQLLLRLVADGISCSWVQFVPISRGWAQLSARAGASSCWVTHSLHSSFPTTFSLCFCQAPLNAAP